MNIEEVKKFLEETEEGQELVESFKKPLIEKRDQLLSELKTVKSKYSDVDVDELRSKATKAEQLEQQLQELKSKGSEGDEKYEELKKSLEDQLEQERSKYNKFIDKYAESSLDSRITQAISRNKGIPDLLKPIVRQRIKHDVDDDGNIQIEVLSKEGKPLFKDGKEASLDDVLEELKTDEVFARAFEGTGSSGSGTRQTGAKGSGVVLDPNDPNYSLTAAMEYYNRNPAAKERS